MGPESPAPSPEGQKPAEVIPIRPEAESWPKDELAQDQMKLAATQRAEAANLAKPAAEQDPVMSQIRDEIVGSLTDHISELQANRQTAEADEQQAA